MNREERWIFEEKYKASETSEFEADKRRLAKGEPAAYIIGYQPFLGLKIYLDSKPLIPRPETEWWVEQLLNELSNGRSDDLLFLDLCAGSGAVGCAALKYLSNARVYFGELNPAHEATMQKNIRENRLDESRAEIRIGDLFEPFGEMQFDVIAANPPYIPETRTLQKSVADYEPHEALFAGEDGLSVIKQMAAELPRRLKEGGAAWIECDSSNIEAAKTLFEKQGMQAVIRTDQYKVPRFLVVSFR